MLIYIAGPITLGNPAHHIHKAILIASELRSMGHNVLLPHLDQLWDIVSPQGYESLLENDLVLLARCDAVLRLPGKSKGADREVETAHEAGIPVYYSISDIPKSD